VNDWKRTAEQLVSLKHKWCEPNPNDDVFKTLGKLLATVVTLAAILVRHWLSALTAAVALGGLIVIGPWAMAFAAAVPATRGTFFMSVTMRAAGMSNVWHTAVQLWKVGRIRRAWPKVAYMLKVTGRGDGEPPAMVNMLPTPRGVKADILTGTVGMDSADLIKLERKFASAFFCDRVTIKSVSPSMAHVVWEWGHHLRKQIRAWEVPSVEQTAGKPPLAAFGIQANGLPAYVVSNLSILVGGMPGGGKSSTIWAIVNALAAVEHIRLRIVDPSGMEFGAAKNHLDGPLVYDYISDPDRPGARPMEDFWAKLEADFNARLDSCDRRGVRRHIPTKEEPLDVLIIDEILPLAGELKKGSTQHIVGRILYLGRKAGYIVLGASQAAQVDVMGRIRDLFPQRLSHQTQTRYATEAFLGDGAEADGAACSKLQPGIDVGIFYMAEAGTSGYTACRSALIDDADIERILQGLRPIPAPVNSLHDRQTSVYALYGETGDLLYVGIAASDRLYDRWDEHRRTKPWWDEVADMKEVDSYPDRALAETAEAMLIRKRQPKYNKQHNTNYAYKGQS
jgi:hypothetical protein